MYNEYSDHDLIELFREKDELAFDALIERYALNVYSLASSLSQSEEQAREVVDDVFVELHQCLLTPSEEEATLEVLIHRITYEKALKSFFAEGEMLTIIPVDEAVPLEGTNNYPAKELVKEEE